MKRELAVAVLLSFAVACSPVLEPDDVAGEYVLESAPVVLAWGDGELEITADTLRVSTDNSATRVVAETFTSEAGSYSAQRVEQYRYGIRKGTVEFSLICPPNALCTPPPHLLGTMTATGLLLRDAANPRLFRLEYERVAPGVRLTS